MDSDNNFILELSTSLEEQVAGFQHICSTIFSRNEFVDCTLCCSDGQLKAHRVILASASNYMHNMLSTTPWPTPCSHPMLFFKTFSMNDMKLALEFIYTGKAKVSRNKLPTLMNIARELGCSSLSKAIEKAIHSFGVEIFRKRIQSQPQTVSASAHGAAFVSSEPIVENDSQSSHQRAKEAGLLSNNDPPSSVGNDRPEDEESLCSAPGIKLEPGENMMLELDPSSIVTTMDSATLTNTNQSSADFSLDVNDEVTTAQDTDIKVDHNLNISREVDSNDEGFQMHDDIDIIIGMKEKDSGNDKAISDVNILNNSAHDNGTDLDDDQMQDEDEEEMPITVVDLKSLAETGSEEIDAKEMAMTSTGMENAELPANCPWCFQVFTSLTLLQRHIKTHVGMYKPYSCEYCPASFARSAHLKRHIRTHTGEKPFVCTFCSRAFSRQDKLKTHLEKHLLDQHLQNSKLTTTTAAAAGFPSLSQSSASLTRPNTVVKPSTSVTTTSSHSPHKQIMQMQGLSTSTNFTQCLPSYQYFINDGSEVWQNQADRISKGLFSVPGQITISTNISPSTTITPIPSLLVPSNPPPPPPNI